MLGIGLSVLAYALFSLHDASIKWLVAALPAWQILFCRSAAIVAGCLVIGRGRLLEQALATPLKATLAVRGAITLAAWLCYYSAARSTPLAQLVTLYFSAPILVTVMSAPLLGERVSRTRWIAVGIGFAGVLVAADPMALRLSVNTALVLIAAAFWAYAIILMRKIARRESSLLQMLYSNGFFLVATGIACLFGWRTPDAGQLALLAIVGVVGGLGQFLLYEGARHAPASLVATFEYSALLWAFVLGYAIWGDIPPRGGVRGRVPDPGAGLLLVGAERRLLSRAPARGAATPELNPTVPPLLLSGGADGAIAMTAADRDHLPPPARLSELARRFDMFLVDQFGVLTDGVRLYPGALDALRALRAAGRRVALLSNSGRRASLNAERLAAMGIPADAYDLFMSSGEFAHHLLRERGLAGTARRCLLLSRGGDVSPLEGTGLVPVADAEAAELVVIAGSEADERPLSDVRGAAAPRRAPPSAGGVPQSRPDDADRARPRPRGGADRGALRGARRHRHLDRQAVPADLRPRVFRPRRPAPRARDRTRRQRGARHRRRAGRRLRRLPGPPRHHRGCERRRDPRRVRPHRRLARRRAGGVRVGPRRLVLIRHPAAVGAAGRCYGRTDLPAGDGAATIATALGRLAGIGLRQVWSSPAVRCRGVARAIATATGGTLRIDPRLHELDFGAWEGRPWRDLPRAEVDAWIADPLHRAPPGGETGAALIARVRAFLGTLGDGAHVVVSHGGPLKVMAALAAGREIDLWADPPGFGTVTEAVIVGDVGRG